MRVLVIMLSAVFLFTSCTTGVYKEYLLAKKTVKRSDDTYSLKVSPKRWRWLVSDQETKQLMASIKKVEVVFLENKENSSKYTQKRIDKFSETVRKMSSEPLIQVFSEGTQVTVFDMPEKRNWIVCLVDTPEEFILVEAKIEMQNILKLVNKPEVFADLLK